MTASAPAKPGFARHGLKTRQQGAGTLVISLVTLLLITFVTMYANSNSVIEIKTSANLYKYAQAKEAAQAGIEYGNAWLGAGSNFTGISWTSDASVSPNDQTYSLGSITVGSYSVAVSLWRQSSSPTVIEIRSISTGDATVTVRQISKILVVSFTGAALDPMVVNGCLSGVTGNPDINVTGSPTGNAVTSSQSTACLDEGHLDYNGGTESGSAFTGSAWDYLFGTSKAEMKLMAQTNSNILYYDASNPAPNNWHDDVGSSSQPAILIFDTGAGCPSINGGPVIYGIIYYGADDCSSNGWGGAEIYGGVVVDADITKYNSNATVSYWGNAGNASNYGNATVVPVPGSWRDF